MNGPPSPILFRGGAGNTYAYSYNDEGIRTSKTINGGYSSKQPLIPSAIVTITSTPSQGCIICRTDIITQVRGTIIEFNRKMS